MNSNLKLIITPIVLALAIVLGMLINSYYDRITLRHQQTLFMPVQGSKLDMVLNMVNLSYVDSVDIHQIEEEAVSSIISGLDPHTVYIPAEDMERVNEDMQGNFGGIGVQFYKFRDTVTVIKTVPGGPSEKAGIHDGDRIVRVDDSIVAGVKMPDSQIMSKLRGDLDTDVRLTIVRRGNEKPIDITVRRSSIPVKSVDVAYMANDTTGYVKVNTFGLNTYDEFMAALKSLDAQGMTRLIVDLRSNVGGILPIALKMVNEFLPDKSLILYTQGKSSPRADFYSNGKGGYQQIGLTVIIDENSASASEIFAGAIQDNDRGTIVGRRSFGKGLVQEQRVLPDGSALRLTVARYYIPSGRCIQRPYDKGKSEYYGDLGNRIRHGELEEKDSIRFDTTLSYKTIGGRTVYGGGGIMPDIFVPVDTNGVSNYLIDLRRTMLLYDYTFDFMDRHRKEIEKMTDYKEITKYLKHFDLVGDMADYAAKNGLKRSDKGIRESYRVIRTNLEAYIARDVLDNDGLYPVIGSIDTTLQCAIKARL